MNVLGRFISEIRHTHSSEYIENPFVRLIAVTTKGFLYLAAIAAYLAVIIAAIIALFLGGIWLDKHHPLVLWILLILLISAIVGSIVGASDGW